MFESTRLFRLPSRPSNYLATVLLAALALAACADGVEVVVTPTPIVIEGRLLGEIKDGFPCIWVANDNGGRTYFVLPPGWNLSAKPIGISDTAGRLVAIVGDRVRATGVDDPFGATGETLCQPGADPISMDNITRITD